ncbi:hypothetical protein [Prevotella dentasini]|nr:hypothetical protein [Prevotella dentasini]
MSEKSKQHRKLREAQQERQAKKVIKWIIICLFLLAIAVTVYSIIVVG